MTTIFIGGSRAVSRLSDEVRAKLDDFLARGCTVFVGDANGADKAVQQHFASRSYPRVAVYCTDRCRNNIGGWPVKNIPAPGKSRDFAFYAAKDRAMAADAACGMMLWDGESKGTLNNIQNLLAQGKKTLVYFAPNCTFHKISAQCDLDALLEFCDGGHITSARDRIAKAGAGLVVA